jgi:hypothetical protein
MTTRSMARSRELFLIGIFILVGAILLIWSVGSSGSFGDCFKEEANNKVYASILQGGPVAGRVLARLQLNATCVGHFVEKKQGLISVVSTIVIAIFTAILGTFTVRLARSTRLAAEAARDSASVIPNTERAFVYVDAITRNVNTPMMQAADKLSPTVPYIRPSFVIVSFVNHGRTPANVSSLVGFVDFLDHTPCDDDNKRLLRAGSTNNQRIMAIIGPGKTWSGPVIQTATPLTFDNITRYESG